MKAACWSFLFGRRRRGFDDLFSFESWLVVGLSSTDCPLTSDPWPPPTSKSPAPSSSNPRHPRPATSPVQFLLASASPPKSPHDIGRPARATSATRSSHRDYPPLRRSP